MKKTTAKSNAKLVKMEFTIDPYQGAAALFGKCQLEGHKLVKMDRKDSKVVCFYEKV